LPNLAVDYDIIISTTDGSIDSVATDGTWSWEVVDSTCGALLNESACKAGGCRWTDDYDTMCNADTIFGIMQKWGNGYSIELLDSDTVYCDSWLNWPAINLWNSFGKGVLYLLSLFYLFLGVAICADIFMTAIEVITSSTYKLNVLLDNGEAVTVDARVWNETVANLTLLALGSSAPEILLALMETVKGLGDPAGELGPATIVGSASFNLFIIIAVCMVSVPSPGAPGSAKDETGVRKITEIGVFLITAFSSLWAYIWLLLCIEIMTPEVVTAGEATVTLLMFPALVLIAWGQDTGWSFCKKRSSFTKRIKFGNIAKLHDSPEAALEELKAQNPVKRSYMVYRASAIREVSGKRNVLKAPPPLATDEKVEMQAVGDHDIEQKNQPHAEVEFFCKKYAVKENAGEVIVGVKRVGALDARLQVEYETADGDAEGTGENRDYEHTEGLLIFGPGEKMKTISITIIEDEEVEDNEMFYVLLKAPRCMDKSNTKVELGKVKICEVMIIDVSLPGQVGFEKTNIHVQEDCGKVVIGLVRVNGSMGDFYVDYITQAVTASPGQHYEDMSGTIKFEANQISNEIAIPIINHTESKDDDCSFKVILTKASNANNEAKFTKKTEALVTISDSEKHTKMVAKLMTMWEQHKGSSALGSDSWVCLFEDAARAPGEISFVGYFVHMLALPWKMILAFIPPTSYAGGWATFFVSLSVTGAITFVIGELAETFACMIGLPKAFAAITFVALGTSMPDTFASRMATQMSPDADAAICNVTGSNSVNVFLGLGLPWCVASYYAAAKNESYITPAGDLKSALTAFIPGAVICMSTLLLRRKFIGGELGGPAVTKWLTFFFFCGLWIFFIVMSI